jgi:predicted nucleic acid-binding protein
LKAVLIDTGALIAIISRDDQHHETCTEQLRSLTPPLFTCWPVITEAAYLLRRDSAALQCLLGAFDVGLLKLFPLDEQAAPWLSAFLARYRDLSAQLADACLMFFAEREDIDTIFTLDRRDFRVFRLRGDRMLHLLPEQL